jgi:hypothetical protein
MDEMRYGLYRAVVEDDGDPVQRMRVRVRIPSLDPSTAWALPCLAPGSVAVPKVGTQVWIMFERGDPRYPVWLGTLGPAN